METVEAHAVARPRLRRRLLVPVQTSAARWLLLPLELSSAGEEAPFEMHQQFHVCSCGL